ncbi:hypothetical protein Trydic_g14520 [Trypoxylus dichotomus]
MIGGARGPIREPVCELRVSGRSGSLSVGVAHPANQSRRPAFADRALVAANTATRSRHPCLLLPRSSRGQASGAQNWLCLVSILMMSMLRRNFAELRTLFGEEF